ncbi:MAG: alpha-ketoglutarate-dependent dioxygenase AlkB [Rhodospirillaceae bacterium]|nr:alpha-ketoglutarate-dependent dioxygenase AlkB [Rhodospirillaceae bacterium]
MREPELPLGSPGDSPTLPDGFFLHAGAVDAAGQERLRAALEGVLRAAPPVRTRVKGGGMTSAAMTNCGDAGWWSDASGYRYVTTNPATGAPWPPIPVEFRNYVQRVVVKGPWPDFVPDACLINFYEPRAKMGLHQDRDEKDFAHPIVTVCLGDAADFMVGGFARGDKAVPMKVRSGDVVVMGGASRMRFHGIRKIYPGTSPLAGINGRYSLTFRKAL